MLPEWIASAVSLGEKRNKKVLVPKSVRTRCNSNNRKSFLLLLLYAFCQCVEATFS